VNTTVEKLRFWLSQGKMTIYLTGEVDKSVGCSYQIFSGFNVSEIIKIG